MNDDITITEMIEFYEKELETLDPNLDKEKKERYLKEVLRLKNANEKEIIQNMIKLYQEKLVLLNPNLDKNKIIFYTNEIERLKAILIDSENETKNNRVI